MVEPILSYQSKTVYRVNATKTLTVDLLTPKIKINNHGRVVKVIDLQSLDNHHHRFKIHNRCRFIFMRESYIDVEGRELYIDASPFLKHINKGRLGFSFNILKLEGPIYIHVVTNSTDM